MILKNIELKNFKKLASFRAEFISGINVVKGPRNEMGKSTLLEGIIAALFYNPKSTSKDIRGYVSWGSARQYQTSLAFDGNGGRYLLQKDFDKRTIRLIEDDGNKEIDTFNEVSQEMARLLGTASDKLFLSSACIRQSQVSQISAGEKAIGESLEEIVTGGDESTLASQVIQKLDSRIAEMRRGLDMPAKNPGVVASLSSQLRQAAQRHGSVKDEVSRVEDQKTKLMEADNQLTRARAEHDHALSLLEKNRRRKDIESSLGRLTREYDAVEELLRRITTEQEALIKADESLRAIEGFAESERVSELREKLDDIRRKRNDIERDLAAQETELAEARRKLEARQLLRFLGSGRAIVAAGAVLAGGIVGTLAGPSYLISLIALGAALLVATMWARAALIRHRTAVVGIEVRIREMKKSLDELDGREKALLTEARCSTIAEFDDNEKSFRRWLDLKRQAEFRLEGMLGGRGVGDIEHQRSELARKIAVEQARLTDDLVATRLSPEEYVELEGRVKALQTRVTGLEDRRRDSLAIIRAARHDAEEQVRLEEELERLQESLKQEERRVRVYQLTRDLVSRARSEVLSSSEEALEQEIQSYLTVFTNGKYRRVRMSKEDLEFWVYSDEKRDWARPEELSGGVVDEFYLAFRLALVRLVFGDRRPPLILDDPFVNFDSVRLASTLGFLKKLSNDYQIIIFTLSDLYDRVADRIIMLGEEHKLL